MSLLLAVTLPGLITVVGALRTPGNQGFEAKWADWLRSHHLAPLANDLETIYYQHQAPARGGRPASLNRVAAPQALGPAKPASVRHLPAPAPVPLVVAPALPGEGQWLPAGPLVGGVPGTYVAQFRADDVYTSQITSAVWIDPSLLRLALVPGAQEPGGAWSQPPDITGAGLSSAVAAFNGGFRLQDAHGGFYLDGRSAVPLQEGAASVVIYGNGAVDVGAWGREVTMTPEVEAVLQNLLPIVDDGVTAPDATYSDSRIWGSTIGTGTVVARSGLGVTATGAVVYVAGPALSARTLAESLQRAGAVRAMSLDINPEWVTFNFYEHSAADPSAVSALKLYPQMQRPATRYLGPTPESRDFFTVSAPTP
ncbi:MAG: phosphodiester glycosidase family protein [Acidimicrobiales bacterium]